MRTTPHRYPGGPPSRPGGRYVEPGSPPLTELDTDGALATEEGAPPTLPSRRLAVAMIEQAVLDLASPEHRRDRMTALRWLRSTDRTWPYSFENVCGALDIEPERLRAKLEEAS